MSQVTIFHYRTGRQRHAEWDLLAGNIFRTNRTGSSGRSGVATKHVRCGKHAALLAAEHVVLDNLQRQRQPWRERPLRTGAGPRRPRAAGSLTPSFPPLTATGTADSGRQRAPPVSRTLARTTPKSLSTNGMRAASNAAVTTLASRDETRISVTRGTTPFLEVGPEVVLNCRLSGDVNQG